uniref:Uncharacterized protein n=1 Tax=Setaria italica TaxID=4555 RepID=K4APG8_SETIT
MLLKGCLVRVFLEEIQIVALDGCVAFWATCSMD